VLVWGKARKKTHIKHNLPLSIRLLLRLGKCLETFIAIVGDRWPLYSLGNVFINGNTVQAVGTKCTHTCPHPLVHPHTHDVKSKLRQSTNGGFQFEPTAAPLFSICWNYFLNLSTSSFRVLGFKTFNFIQQV